MCHNENLLHKSRFSLDIYYSTRCCDVSSMYNPYETLKDYGFADTTKEQLILGALLSLLRGNKSIWPRHNNRTCFTSWALVMNTKVSRIRHLLSRIQTFLTNEDPWFGLYFPAGFGFGVLGVFWFFEKFLRNGVIHLDSLFHLLFF